MIRFKIGNSLNRRLSKVLVAWVAFWGALWVVPSLKFVAGISTLEELLITIASLDFLIALITALFLFSPLYSLILVTIAEGFKSRNSSKYRLQLGVVVVIILLYEFIRTMFNIEFSVWSNVVMEYWWDKYTWSVKSLSLCLLSALGLLEVRVGKYWLSLFYNSNTGSFAISTFNLVENDKGPAMSILSFPTSIVGSR